MYVLHFGHFFENRKNSGLTPGENDDPDVKDDPNDPLTQFHVWCAVLRRRCCWLPSDRRCRSISPADLLQQTRRSGVQMTGWTVNTSKTM